MVVVSVVWWLCAPLEGFLMTRAFTMMLFTWILLCLLLRLCSAAHPLAGTLVTFLSFAQDRCFLRDLGLWQLEMLVPSKCH